MTDAAPWLTLAGLGAFHGLNPAMGWLFAVALGLHRRERRIVWLSLLPIALGHALSIALAALLFLWLGFMLDGQTLRIGSGLILIGWAFYHWRYGHRHRVRFGMQVGLAGLAVWSFLMATTHGAGLMLWPALMPLCTAAAAAPGGTGPVIVALMGAGLHTLAMLAVTALLAVTVYECAGLDVLKRAWINVDLLWTFALTVTGLLLLLG
jgi:hypothetical protein